MYYLIFLAILPPLLIGSKLAGGLVSFMARLEGVIRHKPSFVAAAAKVAKYVAFCAAQSPPIVAFPPSYTSVGLFLLSLVKARGGSTRSVANDLSHLKTQCLSTGRGWLSYEANILLQQLISAAKGEDFSVSNRKDALRFSLLVQVFSHFDLSNPVQLLHATVLAFGQNMLLRTLELTSGIKAHDIIWSFLDGYWNVSLRLYRTKTFRSGPFLMISIADFPHPFSAVSLLRRWWLLNDLSKHPQSLVFPSVVNGVVVPSVPMSSSYLRGLVKFAVSSISLDCKRFSGHSLRAGGATDLFAAQIPYWVIKKMGRWTSDAALIYYRSELDVVQSVRLAYIHASSHLSLS